MKSSVASSLLVLSSVMLLISCHSNDDSFVTHVYTTGYENNADGIPVAVYWKDTVKVELSTGKMAAYGLSIAVANNDVYVAGFEYISSRISVAKYWKNGIEVAPTDGNYSARAMAVKISGSDVYILGFVNGLSGGTARLWKNGEPIDIMDGSKGVYPNSLDVVGDDVYIAISTNETETLAKYWKNGQVTTLPDSATGSTAASIAIRGHDVYVTGYLYGLSGFVPVYWKNGTLSPLPPSYKLNAADAIALSGNNVYMLATDPYGSYYAAYWLNGTLVNNFTDGVHVAEGTDISVDGSDVYLSGYNTNDAGNKVGVYWKNSIPVLLTNGLKDAIVTNIEVVRQ